MPSSFIILSYTGIKNCFNLISGTKAYTFGCIGNANTVKNLAILLLPQPYIEMEATAACYGRAAEKGVEMAAHDWWTNHESSWRSIYTGSYLIPEVKNF